MIPGAQMNSWQHAASENPQQGFQINVNGQFFTANGFLLDGTENESAILGIAVINPNLDSLQVQIVCETIGQSGTRVAYKHLITDRKAVQIGEDLEINETFSLPATASPSMKTVQTATNWCVRIRRQLAGGMSYDTDYPFHVEEKTGGGDGDA